MEVPLDALPPGLHERLITEAVLAEIQRIRAEGREVSTEAQGRELLDLALSAHVGRLVRAALGDLAEDALAARLELVVKVVRALAADSAGVVVPDDLPVGGDTLTWVAPPQRGLGRAVPPARPANGLVHPALLLNSGHDVSLFHELDRELESADRVDAVVSFLRLSGLRLLERGLRRLCERGELRLVTSTYVGATEARAVRELVALGARVRVAYEEDGTRLHAKSWIFHRSSGLGTAYVGSSNLSRSAMTDGAEWNVRVTEAVTRPVLERLSQAFEQLWEETGPDFVPAVHDERLVRSLSRARREPQPDGELPFLRVDATPKPHQLRVLEALAAERAGGHHRNLIVAATGTGKTWMSAFDYRNLVAEGAVDSLLFVAHRKEILTQTRLVFRTVLQDPGFGELMVDGEVPERGRHVFASIQSLAASGIHSVDPKAYDMVVVDEFHHAAAPTYVALLQHLRPVVLLGLTATPERMDGRSVLSWFDQRIAAEIRLGDAMEGGLLAPFHYYGVYDEASVELAWSGRSLADGRLDALYSGDDVRAKKVAAAVHRYVSEPRRMRALAFCAGVAHAEVMARAFCDAGLPAEAVHGQTPGPARRAAVGRLAAGQLVALFTVDLFNEGVDIPSIDTVLFLRPTESATVFLQQLGRGLRRHPGKRHLTVLDFVGRVHRDYRYEVRFRAMVPGTREQTRTQIAAGFPRMPPGCAIVLEEQAREVVLDGMKQVVGKAGWMLLVQDLVHLGPTATLAQLLSDTAAELADVYRPGGLSWSALRRAAGFERRPEVADEDTLRTRVGRMLHVDDPERLDVWGRWLAAEAPPDWEGMTARERALARMLVVSVGARGGLVSDFPRELERLWAAAPVREELAELLPVLRDRVRHRTWPDPRGPLAVGATYTRAEVIAAFGAVHKGRLIESREGPVWFAEAQTDVFFITLEKSEDLFRPSVRYADYPISPTLFHWESQNKTHAGTDVGRRYIEHEARGSRVLLWVRARPKDDRGGTTPFTCLGAARYVRHQGARPMQIVWELEHPMPAWVMATGRVLAAAG